MGIKKTSHIDIELAKKNYNNLIDKLFPAIKPWFNFKGKLDLSHYDITNKTSSLLASLLEYKITIEDNKNANSFCADDILAKQVIVEEDGLLKFWGIIYWLDTPPEYEINKTGQDPFYAEMRIVNDTLKIEWIKCGDYNLTNVDRYWWFDMEMDWIYEFEG
ncbi:hypothetical protein QNI19_27320 [Cytophagaceae bacterium DM2B3-1]|uniref:Uncharacterized protein n=1 Tax=Xanthocytophaga flava TaxID=3048013 RepID=A0ABT7CVQ3_9BACT|nr:hypothetical protein [Xanthocytophaga flavus]MDJ1471477.1 hypothetical protein [Xanthocytophaga flavus]MDJ1496674.1 hypothetical protein [Xanthocytophaga flavus]